MAINPEIRLPSGRRLRTKTYRGSKAGEERDARPKGRASQLTMTGSGDTGIRAQPNGTELTRAAGRIPAMPAILPGPRRGRMVWTERCLRSVEAQPPAHLVLVHDRVGVAARDAGVVG